MDILTSETLAATLTRCVENPHYNAAIMFADKERYIEFLQQAKEISHGWSVNMRESKIKFKNGSYIKAVPIKPGNFFKGQKYHEIIFDGNYSEEEIRYVYGPMLKPYVLGEEEEMCVDEDDNSLDAFLGEFKVNN